MCPAGKRAAHEPGLERARGVPDDWGGDYSGGLGVAFAGNIAKFQHGFDSPRILCITLAKLWSLNQDELQSAVLQPTARLLVRKTAQQTAIAIATILCTLDSDIAALQSQLVKARQIKQGRAQKLLTGRIRLVSPAILNQRVPA